MIRLWLFLMLMLAAPPAGAQQQEYWLQIYDGTDMRLAQKIAEEAGKTTGETVTGFVTPTGLAVTLGPFASGWSAVHMMDKLRSEDKISDSSFVTKPNEWGAKFWPISESSGPKLSLPEDFTNVDQQVKVPAFATLPSGLTLPNGLAIPPTGPASPGPQVAKTLPDIPDSTRPGMAASAMAAGPRLAPATALPDVTPAAPASAPPAAPTAVATPDGISVSLSTPPADLPPEPGPGKLIPLRDLDRILPPGLVLPADQPLDQAQAGEAALDRAERDKVQQALAYFGLYKGPMDGIFGPLTRDAMKTWQQQRHMEPTGVLTKVQRAALEALHAQARDTLGLTPVTDREAGIRIDLPLARVAKSGTEPPFVRYSGPDGAQALLISAAGGADTLKRIYDQLAALPEMPPGGDRTLGRSSFDMAGRNAGHDSLAHAEIRNGAVRGYALLWPGDDGQVQEVVAQRMRDTFQPLGTPPLPAASPGPAAPTSASASSAPAGPATPSAAAPAANPAPAVPPAATPPAASATPSPPPAAASGTFVSPNGIVMTLDAMADCPNPSLLGRTPLVPAGRDSGLGVALLRPTTPLSPAAWVSPGALPAPGAAIAAGGYSYGALLGQAAVTWGSFASSGDQLTPAGRNRYQIQTLAGDAGGPVLDMSGTMIGLLLPRTDGPRELPPDVQFGAPGPDIATRFAAALTAAPPAPVTGRDALAQRLRDATVLVLCAG